jgi:hypothetical protein
VSQPLWIPPERGGLVTANARDDVVGSAPRGDGSLREPTWHEERGLKKMLCTPHCCTVVPLLVSPVLHCPLLQAPGLCRRPPTHGIHLVTTLPPTQPSHLHQHTTHPPPPATCSPTNPAHPHTCLPIHAPPKHFYSLEQGQPMSVSPPWPHLRGLRWYHISHERMAH